MMHYKKQIEELSEWLHNEALRQIEGCRRMSHDGITWCYTPWLDTYYDEVVWEGLVRHLPEPMTWERLLTEVGPGTYQNGGYWPVPASWVIHALRMTNPEKASKTLVDLITHMQRMGVNEWETKDGSVGVPDYVASATLSLIAVREELSISECGMRISD